MANGMGSLYIGVSGLHSAQTALNTTAHNLANINTEGYTRQQITFEDMTYLTVGTRSNTIDKYGLGVSVSEIRRIRDTFIDRAYRTENGRLGYYESNLKAVEEVEDLFGEMQGVTYQDCLKNLYSAVNELSKNPESTVARSSLIQYTSAFVNRSNKIYESLKDYQTTLNTEVQNSVNRINELGQTIFALNKQIQGIESGSGEYANDLRGFKAVDDFNLEVKRGEFVTFLGPSGCGKTTTLRMIAGFELPSSGEILLDGRDIAHLPANKRPINTVFQRYALFPHMNIYENIAFGLKLKKLPKEEIRKKVKHVLAMVDLEGFEDRKIATLSGGQQQRIAIARALVNEPEILMLDEPLGALDLKMRKEMQLELKNMHDQLGITFIYVTHDQEEALTMSDKIVVLSEGKIQQIGTPEDIYNEPKNAFVADFIGESNIFKGIMTGHMKVRFCGGEFTGMDDVPEGTLVDVVVRPEDVIITAPQDGTVAGVVTSVIFKGMHYEVAVESGKYEIIIRTTKCYAAGDEVGICLEPDGIHVMLAEDHTTSFVTTINSDYTLDFNGKVIRCDLTKVVPKSKMKDNVLIDENGETVDISKLKVQVSIQPDDIEMSDEAEAGLVSGEIINLIYKGDHYSYVVRTEYGHDLIVDDEYLWNMNDKVSLVMPEDKMKFQLKK